MHLAQNHNSEGIQEIETCSYCTLFQAHGLKLQYDVDNVILDQY